MIVKIKDKMIIFDPERHRFSDEKGNRIPSVTYFTSIINKSDVLVPWAVKATICYLNEKLNNGEQITYVDLQEAKKQHIQKKEQAASVGTIIHDWINQYISGKTNMVPDEGERVVNGIRAFLKWEKEMNIKWIDSEKVVYSEKYNYCGIVDAVGKIGKENVIIDFKTGSGIYEDYVLQTAGYQIAYEENTKKKISKRIIALFNKETGDFVYRVFNENRKDKRAFLACVELRKRLDELKIN